MSRHAHYLLLGVGAVAVMTATGCDSGGGSSKHLSMTQMRDHLDKVPLPSGATLRSKVEQPRQSVAPAEIVHQYGYTGTARPLCKALLEGIAAAGYTITDINGSPITPTTCATDPPNNSVTPTNGGATLTEPHTSVRIALDWGGNTTIQLGIQDTGK